MSTTAEQKVNPEIAEFVFSHDKHYRALVSWMKSRKLNEHDLANIFAEGSTVAREIWKLYDVPGWPKHAAEYDNDRAHSRITSLAEEAERLALKGDYQGWQVVAAWLRQKAEEER